MIHQGPEIATNGILDATGPTMTGRVTNAYFKHHGIDLPPLSEKLYRDNDEIEGKMLKDGKSFYDLQIADVQFGDIRFSQLNVYHLAFNSWAPGKETYAKCFDEPEMIEPFFDYFCAHPDYRSELERNLHELCGETYLELTKIVPEMLLSVDLHLV